MKKTQYFVILLAVLLCLSGCYPLRPMYEQEDADRITQKGTELMQGWLNKNMPGAELRECTADCLMWRGTAMNISKARISVPDDTELSIFIWKRLKRCPGNAVL